MTTILKPLFTLSQFIMLSFITTLIVLSIYFLQIDIPGNFISVFYLSSIPTYYYFLIFILTFILLPLYYIAYVKYFIIIPKVMLDFFLLMDVFVFNIYHFHIDMMFIDMVINDFTGLGLSLMTMSIIVFLFLIILFIHLWIFHSVKKRQIINTLKMNFLLLIILLGGQIIHIYGNYYKQHHITKFTPYFPYYAPTTSTTKMKKLEAKYPVIIPKTNAGTSPDKAQIFNVNTNKNALFNYPVKPVICDNAKEEKPNILFFVLESWRADMLHQNITPHIKELATKSYQFTNHFSGGNVTISGLFSLLYGLHPSYMQFAQAAPYKYTTVFMKGLTDLGYTIEAYTSSNLNRFSMKAMFFGHLNSDAYHQEQDLSVIENDKSVISKCITSLQKQDQNKPWFKFVFLTSSHHSYQYPKRFNKYAPIPKNAEGFLFNKNIDEKPFLNDYKNSLLFVDSLFGEMMTALKEYDLDKNTVIVVTSDHGEEFNDNSKGFWGHGSNFTKYQTSVPLVVYIPGNSQAHTINKVSSHVDIFPTIFKHILGSQNLLSDFSSGYDLFNLPEERGLIQSSYKDKSYTIDNKVYSTGLFVDSYDLDNIAKKNSEYNYKMINKLRSEEVLFLK